jgi:hypothetical protein
VSGNVRGGVPLILPGKRRLEVVSQKLFRDKRSVSLCISLSNNFKYCFNKLGYYELRDAGHDEMISQPQALAKILLELI